MSSIPSSRFIGGLQKPSHSDSEPRWLRAGWIVPLMLAVVLASRLPAISLGSQLNPDESQLMAQALRLGIDPMPWRGMDGTTGGPMNSWMLFIAHELTMPMNYHWVHGLAAVILAAISVLTYAALRLVTGRTAAAGGGAVAVVSIALAQGANFTHFTSELVPAAIASALFFCIAARLARPQLGPALDSLSGVLLGLLPWAKPQAALGAGVLGLWLAWRIVRVDEGEQGSGFAARYRRLLLLAGSAALPGALILGIVIAGGAWRDFWMSYVKANAAYVGGSNPIAMAKKVVYVFRSPSSALLAGLLCFAAVWGWLGKPGWRTTNGPARELLSGAAWFAAATALAILTPKFPFQHYQILLLGPVSLMAGCMLAIWTTRSPAVGSSRYTGALFVVCMVGFPLTGVMTAVRDARATYDLRASIDRSPARLIAREIRTLCPDASGMAVWGWMPCFYVETGIPPATRHTICHFLIDPSPGRDHLRASFLADIRRERPALIVDAVAAGCFRWKWDSTKRLPSFPELNEYVLRNYVLAAEQNVGEEDDPVRLYVSSEYLQSKGRVVPSQP